MEILLGSRKHDSGLQLVLSEARKVEELLREVNEPWIDWFDFSTAELNDDPAVSEVLAQRERCVLWKLRAKDGVRAYIFVALEIEHGMIQVDYWLDESENATLWRAFKPYLDSKLAKFGIDLSASRSIKEYSDMLKKSIEKQP